MAGAVVAFGVEQRTDEDGKEDYDSFDTHKTQTNQDGRFTVMVAEKYLPDPSPLRKLDVRVTIDHPRYVTYWNTADTRQIAKNGISDTFPEFHAVKLLPARKLTGRLLDADGKPVAKAAIYKQYDYAAWPPDAEYPVTGETTATSPPRAARGTPRSSWNSAPERRPESITTSAPIKPTWATYACTRA